MRVYLFVGNQSHPLILSASTPSSINSCTSSNKPMNCAASSSVSASLSTKVADDCYQYDSSAYLWLYRHSSSSSSCTLTFVGESSVVNELESDRQMFARGTHALVLA